MKKHWLFTTLIALALCVICCVLFSTEAKAASVEDLIFKLNSDGQSYSVYGCKSSVSGDLQIPATYNDLPVTSIGINAFGYCYSLTSVTIPDSVTSIADHVFYVCYNLTGIWVAEDNPNYSSNAHGVLFNKAKTELIRAPEGLSGSYTIPDSVTSIGYEAFYNCDRLTSVTIGNSVTSIGDCAFVSCDRLTSVTIGNSVTSIGDGAFSGCDNLTKVTIPDSVTSIGDYAFSECYSLTSVTIGNSVTSIGSSAFYSCDSLTSVTIGNSVTSIGSAAFSECSSLTSVTIPDGVTSIGYEAFYNCDSLTSVTIPDSVTSIGYEAFYNCDSLTSVTIPDSVTSIGDYAFEDCWFLTDVYYGGTEDQWAQIEISYGNEDLTSANIHYSKSCDNGHHWDSGVITKKATCKVTGVKTYTCGVCGKTKTETIAKKSHSYKAATCTKAKTCKVCKATSGKALGHSYKTTTTKATLSKDGSIVKKCTVCDKVASKTTIKYAKTIKLSKTSFVYNGKVQKPTVTVKDSAGKTLKKGTDYDVTYASGCKKAGTYKVTIKFKGNYSGTKTLTFKINPKAAISTQPKTQKVEAGEKIKFTVKATGTGLKYQWQYSTNDKTWKNCSASAAKKASFSFTSKTSHDGNYYRCKVTDSAGNTVYTKVVRAYVLGIEKQPTKKTVTKNKTAKFTVDASGNGLKYQWQYSTDGGKTWKTCSGSAAKKAAFSFKAKISQNGYYFRCKITDSAKNVIYTSKVKLTVKK